MAEVISEIGGEGSSPAGAVQALASSLKGKGGLLFMERAGGKLTISVEKNDRIAKPGGLPALAWKATAAIPVKGGASFGIRAVDEHEHKGTGPKK